jgi:uncharacterized protein DUF1302
VTSRKTCSAAVAWMVLGAIAPASALYLDEEKDFKFTAVLYSQARMRIVNTNPPHGQQIQPFYQGGTPLDVRVGHLSQWRNFASPAFEGNLTRKLGLWPYVDDLSFRFVGRFTYDGVYDIGPDVFRRSLRRFKANALRPASDGSVGLGGNQPIAIFQGEERVETEGAPDKAAQRAKRLANQEIADPRTQFAQQADPWEIYVNLKEGPLYLRIGRQNLSWGETDGLRLLDVINPVDNFFGLTFDEDLDEKRIPLWMLRALYDLPDFGLLSHFAVEGFGVPGIIDNTQSPLLLQGFLHPFAPPTGCDAQLIADNTVAALQGQIPAETVVIPPGCRNFLPEGSPLRGGVKTSLYERLGEKSWSNSRFGIRFTGVLWRDYTASLVAYRSFTDIPSARVHYLDTVAIQNLIPNFPAVQLPNLLPLVFKSGPNTGVTIPTTVVVEPQHPKETIVGGTLSFFQRRLLPGVVRMEGGYFIGENTCTRIACEGWPGIGLVETVIPKVDYVRWMIGYDVFDLNVPWLSQTNNIIIISQWFNSFRIDSVPNKFKEQAKAAGLPKQFAEYVLNQNPARDGLAITPASRYNAIWSVAVQNYMMHGKLNPQIIGVALTEGDFGVLPNVTYHITDSLQVKAGVAYIFGKFSSLGLFRDRSQAGIRMSYLLN